MGSKYFSTEYIGLISRSYKLIGIQPSEFGNRPVWVMECLCGKQIRVSPSLVTSGKLPLCECGNKIRTDATRQEAETSLEKLEVYTRDRLKSILRSIINRCYNEESQQYKKYGGLGIGIASEWAEDPNTFIQWSLESGYTQVKNLYRYNLDGDYTPRNCYWAIQKRQLSEEDEDKPLFDLDNFLDPNDNSNLVRVRQQLIDLGCIDDRVRISTEVGRLGDADLERILSIIKSVKTAKPVNKGTKLRKQLLSRLFKIAKELLELEDIAQAAYLISEEEKDNAHLINHLSGVLSLTIKDLED